MFIRKLIGIALVFMALTSSVLAACGDDLPLNFIEAEGVRLHYAEAGAGNAGPSVIAIHGASANLCDMKLALLPEAAEERRVVLFDRPGLGLSDRPDENGHDPFVQARLLHMAALRLGLEKPVLVAHSLGGAVALAFALTYPDDISALVLLAPVSHPWPTGADWYNRAAAAPLLGPVFRRTITPIAGPVIAKRAISNDLPEKYYQRANVGRLFNPSVFKANAEDLVHLKSHIRKMHTRYGEVTVPVTIMTGDSDTTVSPVIHATALARDIPHASLHIFEGVDHFIQHKKRLAVLNAINAVFEEGLE
jgi:pimeloyl-ACP methyl ester carboxylesterase